MCYVHTCLGGNNVDVVNVPAVVVLLVVELVVVVEVDVLLSLNDGDNDDNAAESGWQK